ncbi:response regulator [Embleya sp. NPDC056575]|uniref:response regulator n=1 Tax=unclassified Embleya TaxID=2699296 RepID=UPI0036CF3572
MSPLRVVVAEDQALLRTTLRAFLDIAPDLECVGEAADGAAAVEAAAHLRPDVVLMDIRMPIMDGIEATRRITGAADATSHVLVLTTFDLDEYVYAALRAGAGGFLLKDTEAPDLLAAIRVVAAGDALISPAVTRRLIAEFVRRPTPGDPLPDPGTALAAVTPREREVLVLVARGLSNDEIAAHLHLSPATARTHVSRLLTKLHARDRAQLVITAYESGLVRAANP